MKIFVLPALAAAFALGSAASAFAVQSRPVRLAASVVPTASKASADYARALARTGFEAHVMKGFIGPNVSNQFPADESAFDN
jgi:hypothetical protein